MTRRPLADHFAPWSPCARHDPLAPLCWLVRGYLRLVGAYGERRVVQWPNETGGDES